MSIVRVVVVAALLALSACASPNVRLYDGAARPAAEIAVVTMPEQLEVASINGAEVPAAQGMWTRGDKRLELAPGRYEALIYYREVWQNAGDSDVLRSKNPALFTIDAQAGHRYRIDYARPGTYDAARKLAQDFQGWIEDEASGARVASSASGLKFKDGVAGVAAQLSGDKALVADTHTTLSGNAAIQPIQPLGASLAPSTASAPSSSTALPPAPAAAVVAGPPPTGERDWLALMKGWWKQASADERRDFLRWVGEQP